MSGWARDGADGALIASGIPAADAAGRLGEV